MYTQLKICRKLNKLSNERSDQFKRKLKVNFKSIIYKNISLTAEIFAA